MWWGAEGRTADLSFKFSKKNHVMERRIYLQPSNTKWASRKQILCLSYWNCKHWHPLVMSLQDLYSSSEFLLTILLYPLLLGSSSSEHWVWSHDRFLNKTAISLHCDFHSVLWCTCTPQTEHFVSLCAGMPIFEAGLEQEQKEKAQKTPCLLKHSMNLQYKLIIYTIKLS